MIDEVVKYYKGYLERNDTYEDFAKDVNTLGGTFIYKGQTLKNSNQINTKQGNCFISDTKGKPICKIKLIDIWKQYKNPQLSLF